MATNWEEKFTEVQALWRLDYDNPTGAHALLTSGKHSDGYMNCTKIVQDPQLLSEVAAGIIENLKAHLGDEKPNWVVGPAYGAVAIAFEVARQWGTNYGFTEVEYTDEGKMQVLKRFDIPARAKVLVVEDLTTTGGSALKTVNVVKAAGHDVMPIIGLIHNWTGLDEIEGYKLVSLTSGKMNIYDPEDNPLVASGSVAVRPKSNWDKLTGQ